ncbi:MAG: S8 family serine peptidase [Candidatus Moraniibacteriota bacterium]
MKIKVMVQVKNGNCSRGKMFWKTIFTGIALIVFGFVFSFRSTGAFFIGENKLNIQKIEETENSEYIPGEVIVKFKDNKLNLKNKSGDSRLDTFAARKKIKRQEKGLIRSVNISKFEILDGKNVEEKIAELEKDPDVEYAQPNFIYKISAVNPGDDTNYSNLWGLNNTGQTIGGSVGVADADIDAPEAWAVSDGTVGTAIVAVLDTGVYYDHTDLSANMWDGTSCKDENGDALGGCIHGYDFYQNDKDPMPSVLEEGDKHGTHVAGTIAGVDNSTGIVGVAPNAKIMALRVGYGSGLSTLAAIKAIAFAGQNGAKVINASWGSGGSSCAAVYDEALYEAVRDFDGLFIAAAGNSSEDHDGVTYFGRPIDYGKTTSCWTGLNNIIGVAATDNTDDIASFSDYGSNFVDIGAPGLNIYSSVSPLGTESTVAEESFDSATIGALPSGWTKTGDWQVVLVSGLGNWVGSKADVATSYGSNENSTVTLPTYNLSGSDAVIDFYALCDTEYLSFAQNADWSTADYITLEVSNDGSNFSPISKFNEKTIKDSYGITDQDSFSYGIVSASVPSEYITSTTTFRFRWSSDSDTTFGTHGYGCFIDDIYLATSSFTPDSSYEFSSGTSMAAPHVAGLAGLAWGYKPEATKEQIKAAILAQGDPLSSLNGKTVTGMRINAKNTLDFLTTETPTPTPTPTPEITPTPEVTPTPDPTPTPTPTPSPSITPTPTPSVTPTPTPTPTPSPSPSPIPTPTPTPTPLPSPTIIPDETDYFEDLELEFDGDDVKNKKTSKKEIILKLKNTSGIEYYKSDNDSKFKGKDWKKMDDQIKLKIDQTSRKEQNFYFKFKDKNDEISDTYKKMVTYSPSARSIFNTPQKEKRYGTMIQSGENFSPNSSIALYFSGFWGGYYTPIYIKTDAKGDFSLTYKITKAPGWYRWYAVDLKTGLKSKSASYLVL